MNFWLVIGLVFVAGFLVGLGSRDFKQNFWVVVLWANTVFARRNTAKEKVPEACNDTLVVKEVEENEKEKA